MPPGSVHLGMSALWPIPPTGPTDMVLIVAGAVLVLLGLFSWGAVMRRSREATKNISSLNAILDELAEGDLRRTRSSARRHAQADETMQQAGHLWQEFDETFVETRDGHDLLNTVDARDVFSTDTLAHRLAHSRGLAFMPSAMTAVGVLGTFLGLVMGLRSLDLGGSSAADMDELQSGVQQLISGVSLAFTTSVLGVFLSLVTNLFRYNRIAKQSTAISNLQARIDGLFSRHTPEGSLVKIEQFTSDSAESLNELHEKIGTKLQEAVSGVAEDMQRAVTSALESSIAPVLEEVSSSSRDQSRDALESLLRDFENSFREFGTSQAERLSEATDGLSSSAESINAALAQTQSSFQQQHEAMAKQLQSSVEETASSMEERSKKHEEHLLSLLDAMKSERQHSLELAEKLSGIVDDAGTSMQSSSSELRSSSRDLRTVGEQWSRAAESMDEHRTKFSEDFTTIAEKQKTSIDQLDSQEAKLREVAAGVLEAVEQFGTTATESNKAFETMKERQEEFLASLREQVEGMQRTMKEWLDEYSSTVRDQTRERMDDWNKHSRDYASSMRSIAEGLHGALEEINELTEKTKHADPAPTNSR